MTEATSGSEPFPEPTAPVASRAEVFVVYLDYFRSQLVAKVSALRPAERTSSRLPSGWTPLELARHLTYVERRWLEWGFEGQALSDPWGDQRDGRWYVADGATSEAVLAALVTQGERTRSIVRDNDLDSVGCPGPRWEGAEPATLERVLFHLLQEYARHVGHLDVVVELAGGPVGE